MRTAPLEYWIVMFWKQWDPFQIRVTRVMYEVANRQERATVHCEKGEFLILSKKSFQHLNKVFLVAEVEKKKE